MKKIIYTNMRLNENIKDSLIYSTKNGLLRLHNIVKDRSLKYKLPNLAYDVTRIINRNDINEDEVDMVFRSLNYIKRNNIPLNISKIKNLEELLDFIEIKEREILINRFINNLPSKLKTLIKPSDLSPYIYDFYEIKNSNLFFKKISKYKNKNELLKSLSEFIEYSKYSFEERLEKIKSYDVDILYLNEEEKKILYTVSSYKKCNALGSRSWCITTSEEMFNKYIKDIFHIQLIQEDYYPDKPQYRQIGITYNIKSGKISTAHDINDTYIPSNVIRKMLSEIGVDLSQIYSKDSFFNEFKNKIFNSEFYLNIYKMSKEFRDKVYDKILEDPKLFNNHYYIGFILNYMDIEEYLEKCDTIPNIKDIPNYFDISKKECERMESIIKKWDMLKNNTIGDNTLFLHKVCQYYPLYWKQFYLDNVDSFSDELYFIDKFNIQNQFHKYINLDLLDSSNKFCLLNIDVDSNLFNYFAKNIYKYSDIVDEVFKGYGDYKYNFHCIRIIIQTKDFELIKKFIDMTTTKHGYINAHYNINTLRFDMMTYIVNNILFDNLDLIKKIFEYFKKEYNINWFDMNYSAFSINLDRNYNILFWIISNLLRNKRGYFKEDGPKIGMIERLIGFPSYDAKKKNLYKRLLTNTYNILDEESVKKISITILNGLKYSVDNAKFWFSLPGTKFKKELVENDVINYDGKKFGIFPKFLGVSITEGLLTFRDFRRF